jgi:hypothetical protein
MYYYTYKLSTALKMVLPIWKQVLHWCRVSWQFIWSLGEIMSEAGIEPAALPPLRFRLTFMNEGES